VIEDMGKAVLNVVGAALGDFQTLLNGGFDVVEEEIFVCGEPSLRDPNSVLVRRIKACLHHRFFPVSAEEIPEDYGIVDGAGTCRYWKLFLFFTHLSIIS
jgi:hypothetical protein